VILFILKGGRAGFGLFVGLTAVLGLLEYYALVLPGESAAAKVAGALLGLAVVVSFYTGHIRAMPPILVLVLLGFAVLCLTRFKPGAYVGLVLSRHVVGIVYVAFFLGHLILIRGWKNGVTWTLFVLSVVFAGDTAAYYVGKAFGSHKLSPSISPGKTVEGAVGGLAANLVVGALFAQCWLSELDWSWVMGLAVLLGIMGQIGDLAESVLKRSVGSKDSGRLLPGHGGVLDRIDGLLFATPVLYYFKAYVL
jgi:phosphatidate cytidylyltransferase